MPRPHRRSIRAFVFGLALLAGACTDDTTRPVSGTHPTATKVSNNDLGPGDGGGRRLPRVFVWVPADSLRALPMTGIAWMHLEAFAQNALVFDGANTGTFEVTLFDKESDADVLALAKAMVYVRTTNWVYRYHVQLAIQEIMDEWGNPNAVDCTNEPLAVARNLTSYVIAADYVGLDEPLATQFRQWLGTMLDQPLSEHADCVRDNRSLREVMLQRANNWGTMAMAALAAVAAYRNDVVLLADVRRVFDGWLGDRNEYAGFDYGGLCWQPNPAAPVGIGPPHASITTGACTFSLDGALPEELRRSQICDPADSTCAAAFDCDLVTPGTQCKVSACPDRVCALGGRIPSNSYLHGALAGAAVCAEILSRRGYADVYRWENNALRRAAQWLLDRQNEDPAMDWWFSGNDSFVPWLLNRAYGTSFPTEQNTNVGRNMDFTDWTHAPR